MQTCNCHPSPSLDTGLVLAIATVPMQPWETPYAPEKALKQGTIFPALDRPFFVTADGSANIPEPCACYAGKKGGAAHD